MSCCDICRQSRARCASPGRRRKRAFDYIQDQLAGWGYQVAHYQNEARIGCPLTASLTVLGDTPLRLTANGYALSPSTGPAGITGEVAFVGNGMADYAGRDVRGKIVCSPTG